MPRPRAEDGEHPDRAPFALVRGRAAQLNPGNRFETVRLHVLGEHLDAAAAESPAGEQVATVVGDDASRTVINRVDSPDLPMKWTFNPYRGCEHGCIYCYARPTHETLGFSCGLDFETRIVAKRAAPDLLRKELAAPKWRAEPIMVSGVTDAYQPTEAKLRLTRACMEIFAEARQPITIVTKNRLVTRDIDLLSDMARHNAAAVALSLTTLDPALAAKMEPRASSPRDRLRAIEELRSAGVPVMVMMAPIIPALTDHEIPTLLKAAADAGAMSAAYVLVRLPYQVKDLFTEWLGRNFPDRAAKVLGQLREARGGKLYDATSGRRMVGDGARADQIGRAFEVFRRRYGLDGPFPRLSGASFRAPAQRDADPSQGLLFGPQPG